MYYGRKFKRKPSSQLTNLNEFWISFSRFFLNIFIILYVGMSSYLVSTICLICKWGTKRSPNSQSTENIIFVILSNTSSVTAAQPTMIYLSINNGHKNYATDSLRFHCWETDGSYGQQCTNICKSVDDVTQRVECTRSAAGLAVPVIKTQCPAIVSRTHNTSYVVYIVVVRRVS